MILMIKVNKYKKNMEMKGKGFRRWWLTSCLGKARISGEVLRDGDHVRVHGSNEETEHSIAVAWIQ